MGLVWCRGRVLDEEDLKIPVSDRTFEHGLGLFETLRTYDGRASLLDRHLQRLRCSAKALGLRVGSYPGHDAVAVLRVESRMSEDVRLRVTASGGSPGGPPSSLWMSIAPLPPPSPEDGLRVDMVPRPIAPFEPLANHKTLNYWSKRLAFEAAQAGGADEGLLATADGRIWEATRSNVWIRRGSTWITPGLDGPVLPGIFRAWMIEHAADIGRVVIQADLRLEHLLAADEIALSNSVRGLVPVGWVAGQAVPAQAEGFPGVRQWNEAFRAWVTEERNKR